MNGRWFVPMALALSTSVSAQGRLEGRVRNQGEEVPNAVVYLLADGPHDEPPAPRGATIDQRDLRFTPRILVVRPGAPVDFLNSDSLLHNVFSPIGPSGPFDLGTYQTGERRTRVFSGVGTSVILCHVHPEMVAYVVSVPTDLHALTDEHGYWRIDAVPAGKYQVMVAHRRRHYPGGVVVMGGGRQQLDIAIERPVAGGVR